MPEIAYDVLIPGFPARSSRGFLGWSTVTLLHTAAGPVLFDTGGAGERLALVAALEARGIAPADIKLIVLSHLHFDHVGNVECFPRAELVVHQDELAYFYEHQGRDPALPVYQVEGMLARSKLQLINGELEILPGLKLLQTPGHTGGHCSLMFSAGGSTVILAQDAIKHRQEAISGQPAGSFDAGRGAESIRRILGLADVIVPGHDATLAITASGIAATEQGRVEMTLTTDGRTQLIEA